jgi:hypothetical protein
MARQISASFRSPRVLIGALVPFALGAYTPGPPADRLDVPLVGSNSSPATTVVLAKPDLVIASFRRFDATTPPRVMSNGGVSVEVVFTVRNSGQQPAGTFRLITRAISPSQGSDDYSVELQTRETSSVDTQGSTTQPLIPGATITARGAVSFEHYRSGEQVTLFIVADGCAPEESMPAYCRVDESSESNNKSQIVKFYMP